MTLKTIHVIFVTVCVLFFGGFAAYCFSRIGLSAQPDFAYREFGFLSVATGGALLFYGNWFLAKLKKQEALTS